MFSYSPQRADDAEPEQPYLPWWGAPEDELGVAVPAGVVIARSPRGAVALSHVVAYTTGAQFEFVAVAHGIKQSQVHTMFHAQHADPAEETPDEFLRVGLELADGIRVSNLGGRWARDPLTESPDQPVFHQSGGGGGSGTHGGVRMRPGYWLWPLPPSGALTIWCEWPAIDIALASVEIDAAEIVAAASRSQPLDG